ncbi:hypothetical protein C0J52_10523 [Blattella germanica]|nr:hypothetical protein C0J52_10523 [Blattella germanica]
MECSSEPLTPQEWKKLHLHLDQEICRDMIPRHYNCEKGEGCIQPQGTEPPYEIYANFHAANPGQKVTVTLNVTGDLPVRGVVVQAHSYRPGVNGKEPLGYFLKPSSESTEVTTFLETCPGGYANNNTLFMYSQFGVRQLNFTWVAPEQPDMGILDIHFWMTTVFKYDTFWVNQMQTQPYGLVILGQTGEIIVVP